MIYSNGPSNTPLFNHGSNLLCMPLYNRLSGARDPEKDKEKKLFTFYMTVTVHDVSPNF